MQCYRYTFIIYALKSRVGEKNYYLVKWNKSLVVNKYKDEINTIFCVNELKNKNIDYSLHISDDS